MVFFLWLLQILSMFPANSSARELARPDLPVHSYTLPMLRSTMRLASISPRYAAANSPGVFFLSLILHGLCEIAGAHQY